MRLRKVKQGKGRYQKHRPTCIVRDRVRIWEAGKGCPNAVGCDHASSLLPMAAGSPAPGPIVKTAAPQGGLWDYKQVTEPAWGGEHRKLVVPPLYKTWKRDGAAAAGYSRLCQLVAWASISPQPPLLCQPKTKTSACSLGTKERPSGTHGPWDMDKKQCCLLQVPPEASPGHRGRSVRLVELQGTFGPQSF